MGVFVSTVSADVSLPKLGIVLVHPTTNYDLGAQFSGDDLKRASDLTAAITGGSLTWKRTAGGAVEAAGDYDPDFLDIDNENLGPGLQADRVVTFKDLTAASIVTKAGRVAAGTFTGSPKKATVTFAAAFSSTNYSVNITGLDGRTWTIESKVAASFVINSNANQALTGDVHWQAQTDGEVN